MRTLAAFLALLGAAPAGAAETAAFLKISPAARPMAMGEAFTAVADDVNALATNPAGLGRAAFHEVSFMHAELFAQTHYDFVGYAHPLAPGGLLGDGTVGVGLQRLSQAALEGRDASRNVTGSFAAADTAASLAYGRRIAGVYLGGGVKFIQSELADATARTVAFDLGAQKPLWLASLPMTVGASILNLGPGMRYLDSTENLPLTVAGGVSLPLAGALLLSLDVRDRPYGGGLSFGLGSEYAVLPAFSVRAGYGVRAAEGPAGAAGLAGQLQGIGVGFGLKLGRASLDYSFSPSGELGVAQRVALSSRF